jgi:hypothetical protein
VPAACEETFMVREEAPLVTNASSASPFPCSISFAPRAIASRARLVLLVIALAAELSSVWFISSGDTEIGCAMWATLMCACRVSSTCGIVTLPPSASACVACRTALKIGTRTWLPEKFLRERSR